MKARRKPKPAAPQASARAEKHARSMLARPVQALRVRAEEREGGGLLVTVRLHRPGWQRLLGGGDTMEKSFGLDAIGRQVYDWCDGRSTVEELARRFARQRQVSVAEAEAAVTTFLRTLVSKGLVVMEMDRPGSRRQDGA